MAWTTPITSNNPANKVTVTTFDKIGANQVYLKERADTVDDRLGQSLNASDSPTFENVTLSGMAGTVEGRIETNTANISSNGSDISTLQGNRVVIGSNASLNSVTTDNVAIKQKLFTGTLDSSGDAIIAHGLSESKIIGVISSMYDSGSWRCNSFTSSSGIISLNMHTRFNSTSIFLFGGERYISQPYRVLVTYQA